MFQQFSSQVNGAPMRKRGLRGLACGFDGLADNGSSGSGIITSVGGVYYQLPAGVALPNGWYVMSDESSLWWLADNGAQMISNSGGTGPTTTSTTGTTAQQSARPGFDYVRAGDVVRVAVSISLLSGGPSTADLLRIIEPQLATANLTYVDGSAPGWFSTTLTVDVQARNDFSHLTDIASVVNSIIGSTGIGVSGLATAAFVSKVEDTGGTIKVNKPPANNQNPLGLSTTTLLMAGGLLLIVVLARK